MNPDPFSQPDPEEAPATPATAETAFDEAKRGFVLGETALRPYTRTRVVAGQSMGLRYPYIGDDGAEQMAATGLYPGALKDTIIVLWLCSIPNASEATAEEVKVKAWTVQGADRKPQAAYDAALAWAEERGLCELASETFAQAYAVYSRIVGGQEVSKFEPAASETGGKKGVADPKLSCAPPGAPNTP